MANHFKHNPMTNNQDHRTDSVFLVLLWLTLIPVAHHPQNKCSGSGSLSLSVLQSVVWSDESASEGDNIIITVEMLIKLD